MIATIAAKHCVSLSICEAIVNLSARAYSTNNNTFDNNHSLTEMCTHTHTHANKQTIIVQASNLYINTQLANSF